jgi:hypothetical protein
VRVGKIQIMSLGRIVRMKLRAGRTENGVMGHLKPLWCPLRNDSRKGALTFSSAARRRTTPDEILRRTNRSDHRNRDQDRVLHRPLAVKSIGVALRIFLSLGALPLVLPVEHSLFPPL